MFKNLFKKKKYNKKDFNNLTLNYNLSSIYSDVDGLSLQNLFYTRNGYFPNCFMFTHSSKVMNNYFDVQQLLAALKEKYNDIELEYIEYVTKNLTTKEERLGFCVILNKQNIFARLEPNISESYILYGNNNGDALKNFIEILETYYVEPEEEKNNLYKIAQTNSGFALQKSKIKEVQNFSIERQYNDDFKHEDEKIRKFIENNDKSGLVILHGEKGTGKTTYIRNLISSYPSKKFVYVSPDLVGLLGQPTFTNFLNSLSNHVIILEDCENVIRDRKNTGITSAVSVLLNMSDGLLADDLGIKFICTFNEDINDIDSALMRKGRLISKYEFKPLTLDKTKALFDFVYNSDEEKPKVEIPAFKKGLTLADIYNYFDDSYEIIRKQII